MPERAEVAVAPESIGGNERREGGVAQGYDTLGNTTSALAAATDISI